MKAGGVDETPDRTYSRLREQLNIRLYDCLVYPDALAEDGEDPMIYVSACAFRAYLRCCDGDFYYFASWLQENAFMALEQDEAAKEMRPGVGDAYVMGAAICMLISAEATFDGVRKGDEDPREWAVMEEDLDLKEKMADEELSRPDDRKFWPNNKIRAYRRAMQKKADNAKLRKAADKAIVQRRPHTWKQWHAWERLLRVAAENSRCSERARSLAREAANRMVSMKSEWEIDHNIRKGKMKQ
jgi:hypothetical protein